MVRIFGVNQEEVIIMKEFVFDGNDRCLDFINTEMYEGDQRIELLDDFSDIVDWLKVSGLVDSRIAKELMSDNNLNKKKVLKYVKSFRSNLKNLVKEMARGKFPGESGIKAINQILKTNKVYSLLHNHNGSIELVTVPVKQSHDPLILLAECAVELLTQKDLALVKKCNDPVCTIFFYDESKNHTRRWCSMNRCGNRAKASSHYRKMKNK